jgi:hypothetical protein
MANWYYCAEQFRHKALGLIPEETSDPCEVGTMMHKVLEESMGRRFPWEEEFMAKLAKYQDKELGFVRRILDTEIYCDLTGHPDDIQVTPAFCASIVENKSTANPEMWVIQKYKLPVAKFQSSIYSWILEPIYEQIGAVASRVNAVNYWDSGTFRLLGWFPVEYYPAQTEQDIYRAVKATGDPSLIIKPQEWKCKKCPKAHKELCQFCLEE